MPQPAESAVPLINRSFKKLLELFALLVGVMLLSFILFEVNPEATYSQLGKSASAEDIADVRRQLGYDQSVLHRFGQFAQRAITLDFGRSWATGESVTSILFKTVPVSLLTVLPGFLLGNGVALLIALVALTRTNSWFDQLINALSVLIMSTSFVVLMIGMQVLMATDVGFSWLPTRGWGTDNFGQYFASVALPSLILITASMGYNLRFFRGVLAGELGQPYVQTARAFGADEWTVLRRHVLPNTWSVVLTRLVFSLPIICVSGSLLLESYFGIPGVGLVTYNAIQSGDMPVLQALVLLSGLLFAIVLYLADWGYRLLDPRQARVL